VTTKEFQLEILRRVEEALNSLPKERLKDVIERRFGFKDGNRKTLEAVGQDYGITRERDRQIESDALSILRERQNLAVFKPIFERFNQLFEEHNHLIGEERFLNLVTGISEPHPARAATIVILTLGKPYQRIPEDERFHSHWVTKKQSKKQAEKVLDYLTKYFNQRYQTLPSTEIMAVISSKYNAFSEKFIRNALDISKEISENIFEEMGLSHWPEINPKGVRDKAYLVIKKETEPRHFTEIADLINRAGFSSRQAFSQTVHIELI